MGGLDLFLMGSTALGVGGGLFKAFSATRAGELQSRIAGNNTRLLLRSAELQDDVESFVLARANFQATQIRDAVRKVAGAQVTHWAANNLDPTKGSPMLIAMQTAEAGEADVNLARAQGWIDAADVQMKKANILGQAAGSAWQEAAIRERAFSDRIAGYFGAAGAFLNTARAWPGLREGNDATTSRYAVDTFGGVGAYPY